MSLTGFTILPITYSASKSHYLYAKAQNSFSKKRQKNAQFPNDRTLFLVNVPPDATDRELVAFFKHAGTIERVVFDQDQETEAPIEEEEEDSESEQEEETMDIEQEPKPSKKSKKKAKEDKPPSVTPIPIPSLRKLHRTGQTAHIIFLDPSSLAKALTSPKPRPWPAPSAPTGLAHYSALYDALRPPLDSVVAFADSSMALYDYKAAKAMAKFKSEYKKGEAIVDDDGFTLVVRGGAYGKTIGGGIGVASKKWEMDQASSTKSKSRRKKEPKEKPEFYAFQKAEKQRANLLKLREKWEEDKAKVEKLKQSRRFRPY